MFASLAVPVYTFGGAFGKNWDATISARADYFTLTTPSNYVITAGPEFRFQFSKPTCSMAPCSSRSPTSVWERRELNVSRLERAQPVLVQPRRSHSRWAED